MPEFSKEIRIHNRHLHFPIRNGAEKIRMRILLDGRVEREFEAELALVDAPPHWWTYYDVSALHGKVITLESFDSNLSDSQCELLSQLITQSDGLVNSEDLFHERYRPQLRFTPKRGWNNDPNGLVYYQGIWHMFYQWNPFGIGWGNMHWGHATSRDLWHWKELPVTLFQKTLHDSPWSGGAVVDEPNTSGFGIAAEEPLVLSFTSTGRGECIAFSLDGGRSFQEYNGNPVIAHKGRDPKIFWFAPQQKWVMIVYDETETPFGYILYSSKDLKTWQKLQLLPGWWECPEIFELPIENGDPGERLWVVYGGLGQHVRSAFQIGHFNGETFYPLGEAQPAHAGPHFYAAQIFSNAPQDRRIMVGWLRDANYPEMPFGNGMSVPLELKLRRVNDNIRLCFTPVSEIEQLRIATIESGKLSVERTNLLLAEENVELMDIELELEAQGKQKITLDLRGYPLVYDPSEKLVTFAGQSVASQPNTGILHLRILVDRSVTEVFVDHGWRAFASMTIFADQRPVHLDGPVTVHQIKVHKLKSIWS